jgi:polysaccharide export outer membrane protein
MSMRALLIIFLFFCSFLTGASAQTLHPGDEIHVSVWQDPKLDQTVVVAPNGEIGFPLAGHMRVSGMTTQAVEAELKRRLASKYSGDLDITVSLVAVNKEDEDETRPKVYITGEVLRPGPVPLKPSINVMQAISLAGGLGPFAARQRIQLHRKINGVDSIFIFDYNSYLSGRDTADNINLRSGDIIIVPERGLLE